MKFYCDSCNAKYLISDDKVAGKILKIKCKKCQHIMVVREPTAVAVQGPYSSPDAPSAPPADSVEWFYAIRGQTQGPFALPELRSKFATGQLGDEAYVWNHTMAGWIPAVDAPEFAQLFQRGVTRKPAKPTMTISAVDVHSVIRPQRASQHQEPGLSRPQRRPESSTSHILKRASSAHSRATGSQILSRPGSDAPPGAVPETAIDDAASKARSLEKLRGIKEAMAEKEPEPGRQQSVAVLRDRLKQIRRHKAADNGPASGSIRDRVEQLKAQGGRDEPGTVQGDVPHDLLAASVAEQPDVEDTAQMSVEELSRGAGSSPASIDDTREVSVGDAHKLIARTADPDPTDQFRVAGAPASEPDVGPAAPAPKPSVETPDRPAEAAKASLSDAPPERPALEPADAPRLGRVRTPEPVAERAGEQGAVVEHHGLPDLDSIQRTASTMDRLPKMERAPKITLGAGVGELGSGERPAMPRAGAPMVSNESGAMSRSLLIQLDTIKRQNRGVRMVAVAGFLTVLLLGGAGAAVAYFFLDTDRFADLKERDREAQAELEAAPKAKTDFSNLKGYKTEEFAELIELPESTEPEPELTFDEDSVPLAPEDDNEDEGADKTDKKRKPRVGKRPKKEAGPAIKETPAVAGNDAPTETAEAAQPDKKEDQSPMSVYEKLASSRPKYKVEKAERPADDGAAPGLPDTLKREDLVRGFKNVRRSADQCLERHLKRQGRLPKGKVKVVVTINGNGKVSALNMDQEVSNTLFDSCMRAHKSRWRFPQFSGKPLLVSRVFVLQ